MTTAEDDTNWLTQLDSSPPVLLEHSLSALGRSSSVQFSAGGQAQDALHAYDFDPPFALPSLHSDPTQPPHASNPLQLDPLIFHTPRLPSAAGLSRVSTQQARRATVSLASPHFNRLRYQAGEGLWSGLTDHVTSTITPPPTLDAAHNLLAAWAVETSLIPELTLPEDAEPSSSGTQPQWDPQTLSQFGFEPSVS